MASYNAGSGNVRKWIRAYGDPRGNVDMVRWIEAIPFMETRGYVQRVIENSVVYDSISRQQSAAEHDARLALSRQIEPGLGYGGAGAGLDRLRGIARHP